jgi:hypothetical protein
MLSARGTSYCKLIQGFGGFENLFGTGADPIVLRQVDPAYGAVGSDEEFGGTCDVATVHALSGVDEVVTANGFEVGIGEYGESEAGLAREVARDIGRIYADGDGIDSGGANLRDLAFDTP